MIEQFKRDPLRLAAAAGILIVSLSAAYYLVVFLPRREMRALEIAARADEARQKEIEERSAEVANRESLLAKCLEQADESYHLTWASQCKLHMESQRRNLASCLEIATSESTKKLCRALHEIPSSDKNCTLPGTRAEIAENASKDIKDECYRRYRASSAAK